MWLKFILGAAIIAFCTLLGYLAAGKYRARRAFYTQFCSFHDRYLNELNYRRRPIAEFLRENRFTGDFGKAVAARSPDRELKCAYLNKREKQDCAEYFSMLGKGDARSQTSFFSAQSLALGEKKKECEREAKARSELYLKLGLIAGLAFVILIV